MWPWQRTGIQLSLLIIRLEVVMVTKPWYVKKPKKASYVKKFARPKRSIIEPQKTGFIPKKPGLASPGLDSCPRNPHEAVP
jgi:hypothetical protein